MPELRGLSGLPGRLRALRVACADSFCSRSESCESCASDRGACPRVCGDSLCAVGHESAASCPSDCRPGQELCGDGRCEGAEDCLFCAADCTTMLGGLLRYGASCDLTVASCGVGSACIPVTAEGRLNEHVFSFGDGLCEPACAAGSCAEATP